MLTHLLHEPAQHLDEVRRERIAQHVFDGRLGPCVSPPCPGPWSPRTIQLAARWHVPRSSVGSTKVSPCGLRTEDPRPRPPVRANEVRLWLSVTAYNPRNLWRRLRHRNRLSFSAANNYP